MLPIILVSPQESQIKDFLLELRQEKNEAIIIFVSPKKQLYSIDDIREIKNEIFFFEKKRRIYFLRDFHRSSIEAQNAFLKILEEPPAKIQFILTTESIYALLPTIISRAKVINLEKKSTDKNKSSLASHFSITKILKEAKLVEIKDKEEALKFIEELILFFKKELIKNPDYFSIIKEAVKIRYLILSNNLNWQLSIDHLLIFIKRKFMINFR